jgi:5-methylcytosine-specific restriction endonuclease McrA
MDKTEQRIFRVKETARQVAYLKERRKAAKVLLGSKCIMCGTSERLDFDHINPDFKEIEISGAIAKHWAWDQLVIELKKCQLLCRSCHIKKTTKDYKNKAHCGTYWMYRKYKCRCAQCNVANSAMLKHWKLKNKLKGKSKDE